MAQRPNQLTPQASPTHFWGSELRARRVSRGLSLEELGRRVHRDRSYLARIERGERTIPAELAKDCDRVLGDDGTLVRLHAMVVASDGPHVATRGSDEDHVAKTSLHVAKQPELLVPNTALPAALEEGEEISVPARTPDGKVIFVSVSRRHFLSGLGASAVSTMAPPVSRQPNIPFPRAAFQATAPDLHPVEHLEQMRKVLIDSDNLFGPAQVIPTVTEQIKLIQNLRQSQRGADQKALLHMQAKYAELTGWFHQDLGDHATAEYWTNRALEWSHGAQDHDLTVFILARKAQLAGDSGDALQTIDMGMAAENVARPRSRLAGIAATFMAHGHALQGDLDATLRAYDHAMELLSSTDDDPHSPWGVWLDGAYIDVARYRSLSELGEFAKAAEGFESAITALPPEYRRDRGVYLARAARAYAGAGDPDHAAALGTQALAIGVETNSGRILTELTQLDDTLAQWRTSGVTDFREAMAETIGRQV